MYVRMVSSPNPIVLTQYVLAQKYYQKALDKDPDDLEALARLVDSLTGQQNWDQALSLIQSAVSKKPGDHSLQLLQANIFLWTKNFDKARKKFNYILGRVRLKE